MTRSNMKEIPTNQIPNFWGLAFQLYFQQFKSSCSQAVIWMLPFPQKDNILPPKLILPVIVPAALHKGSLGNANNVKSASF